MLVVKSMPVSPLGPLAGMRVRAILSEPAEPVEEFSGAVRPDCIPRRLGIISTLSVPPVAAAV